jgi:hypothetical protein
MRRAKFVWDFFWVSFSPVLRWGTVVSSVLGFIGVVREFVPPPYSEYRIWDYFPNWSASTWVAILLFILLVGFLEAAYTEKQQSESRQERNKLVGIDDDWVQPRKPLKPSVFVAVMSCVIVIVVVWGNNTETSAIKIVDTKIGWQDSHETLVISQTDYAEPARPWEANIYYTVSTSRKLKIAYSGTFMEGLPLSESDRDQREDMLWDTVVNELKYAPEQVVTASTSAKMSLTSASALLWGRNNCMN